MSLIQYQIILGRESKENITSIQYIIRKSLKMLAKEKNRGC